MHRLFFALTPDPLTRQAIERAALAVDLREARRVRPENFHLTLHFVGATDTAMKQALLNCDFRIGRGQAITLQFGRAGTWRSAGVSWLAPYDTPRELAELHEAIRTKCPVPATAAADHQFSPHITIARQARRSPRVTGSIEFSWIAEDFCLLESISGPAGVRYERCASWPI